MNRKEYHWGVVDSNAVSGSDGVAAICVDCCNGHENFSRRQEKIREAATELARWPIIRPKRLRAPSMTERLMHRSKEFVVVERLEEEADRTDLSRNRFCDEIVAAGNNDDARLR